MLKYSDQGNIGLVEVVSAFVGQRLYAEKISKTKDHAYNSLVRTLVVIFRSFFRCSAWWRDCACVLTVDGGVFEAILCLVCEAVWVVDVVE